MTQHNTHIPIISIPDYPSTHWSQWDRKVQESFLSHRPLWQHPGLSPLAKETFLDNTWTLDTDTESVLRMMADVWSRDIDYRRDDLSDDLVSVADMYRYAVLNYETHSEYYDRLIDESMGEIDISEENDDLFSPLSDDLMEKLYKHSIRSVHLRGQVRSHLVQLLVEIIEHGYTLGANFAITVIAADIFAEMKTRDDVDDVEFYIVEEFMNHPEEMYSENHKYEIFRSLVTESSSQWSIMDTYLISLLAYPANNLASYVHDVLVYLYSVQDMVLFYDDRERSVAVSGALLSSDKDVYQDAFGSVIINLNRWSA